MSGAASPIAAPGRTGPGPSSTGQGSPPGEWSEWLSKHGPALLLLARQWVPGRADADDVVQEAFLRFWRSRDRADDPTAYLFGCLRGCALEWLRGERRRKGREGAAVAAAKAILSASEGGGLFSALDVAAQDERRRLIESSLAQLPAAQREVLVMKVWGGLTYPQIAAAVGIPADTAASRYRYATAKLRESLGGPMAGGAG